MPLTYNDRKAMLAAALNVREWNIDDLSDTEVFYTFPDESVPAFKGSYKRTYAIDENNKITLGNPVQGIMRRVFEPIIVAAAFSLEQATVEFTDADVIHTGKVFEVGEYPDKGFSLTEAEADDAIAAFTPVANDLEHQPTLLSGKLGQLRKVWRDGKNILGQVALPKWLNDQLGDDPLKVSLAWAKDSKRIIGNALTLNPRVKDAQLIAAFTAATTPEGGPGTMPKPKWFERLASLFSDKKLPEGLEDFDPEAVTFKEDSDGDKPTKPGVTPPAPAPTQPAAPSAEFTALRDENAGLKANALKNAAETFFAEALQASKVVPAERASLVAMFVQAAKDDSAGVAAFSADGVLQEGPRVKVLRDMLAARPAYTNLTSERLPDTAEGSTVVLMSANKPGGGVSEARKAELLEKSGYRKEAK